MKEVQSDTYTQLRLSGIDLQKDFPRQNRGAYLFHRFETPEACKF